MPSTFRLVIGCSAITLAIAALIGGKNDCRMDEMETVSVYSSVRVQSSLIFLTYATVYFTHEYSHTKPAWLLGRMRSLVEFDYGRATLANVVLTGRRQQGELRAHLRERARPRRLVDCLQQGAEKR